MSDINWPRYYPPGTTDFYVTNEAEAFIERYSGRITDTHLRRATSVA